MPNLADKVFGKKDDGFDIIIGDFMFDFFLTESGSLGITVAKKNDPEYEHCVDIYVDKHLNVISG